MSRETVLEELPILIKHCFGENDSTFCSHVLDEKRASELLFTASTNDITLDEIIVASSSYLKTRGVLEEKIENELKKVEKYFYSLVKDSK